MKKSILIVVTSCKETPTGDATGVWLEEFTVPYVIFNENGLDITVASITGGNAPVDPRSKASDQNEKLWSEAINALKTTIAVSEVNPEQYDAVFFPGGHGTMFDLPNNPFINKILQSFQDKKKMIAAVCHGPACFIGSTLNDGTSLVANKTITSFSNDEEVAAGQDTNMPFMLETELVAQRANYIKSTEWSDHIEIDENIITGQNPQSSESIGNAIVANLKK